MSGLRLDLGAFHLGVVAVSEAYEAGNPAVRLSVQPERDDAPVVLRLDHAEARCLAAALCHFADVAERACRP